MENPVPRVPSLPNEGMPAPPQVKFTPAVRVLLLLCAAMIGFVAVTALFLFLFPKDMQAHLKWATFIQDVFVFIIPAMAAMALCFRRPLRQMGLFSAPSWRALAVVVTVWAVSLPAMNWIVEWNKGWWLPGWLEWMREAEEQAAQMTERLLSFNTVDALLATLFVVAFMAGLSEEIFFRGAMQRMLTVDSRRPWLMVWVVAAVFSAIHFQFLGFVPRMLLGAWFGYLMLWTRSLWVPIAAHTLNNATVVVASYLGNIGLIDSDAVDRLGIPDSGFPWLAAASAVATAVMVFVAYVTFSRKKVDENCRR